MSGSSKANLDAIRKRCERILAEVADLAEMRARNMNLHRRLVGIDLAAGDCVYGWTCPEAEEYDKLLTATMGAALERARWS